VQPQSGYHLGQLLRDNRPIADLHTSEAAGSRMRCECIRDQDTLQTQDEDSTMQRIQMPPLHEMSHSTALRPVMAAKVAMAAMAAMATMAAMSAMAAVLSFTGRRDYGNRSIYR
jgi:hypothetical protein